MTCRRARTGYASNPPSGGGASSQYLAIADGVEIGSSGKVADGASSLLNLTVDNGQTAAVAASGLSGLIGAVYWDLGATPAGNISAYLELTSIPLNTHVCVAIWRAASPPATLQAIEDATAHFLQVLRLGSGNTATATKTGTAALGTTVGENKAGSTTVGYSVGSDANGFGPALSRHEHGATSTANTLGTVVAAASGNRYVALLWGKNSTAGSEETVGVKLRAGALQ